MNQSIIDRAVAIATKAALNGTPVKRIEWLESPNAELCGGPTGPSERAPG